MESTYRLLTEKLTEHFRIDPDRMTPDTTFAELRIDSLFLTELEAILEDTYDVAVRVALKPSNTLGEAAARLDPILNPAAAPAAGGATGGAADR
jgi:acyl carrier protein